MGKVRINDLARELEVKSKAVLDYLPELGVTDKRSHSSALDDDVADKVRQHFRALGQREAPAAGPSPAVAARVSAARPEVRTGPEHARAPEIPFEFDHEAHPLTRTIEQIKADARRTLAAVHKAVPSEKPPERPTLHTTGPAAARTERGLGVEQPARVPGVAPAPFTAHAGAAAPAKIREGVATDLSQPLKAGIPSAGSKQPRSAVPGKPAANQPIYPGVIRPKPLVRPPASRRPGEHRPMHPTATRPATAAGLPAAGAPVSRPPIRRPLAPRAAPHPRVAQARAAEPEEIPITRSITISEGISIKELSEKLEVRAKDVIKRLLDKGVFATINQTLDSQTATEISRAFGADTLVISYEEEIAHEVEGGDRPEDLVPRAPVVTVMGHVDHGKTSLLDAIRETNVTAHEAGGITQHIGAYHVEVKNRQIVFLDTPGHEAFTLMRARGAKVTDIVVLVVAADDGVMPQTLEAINHARAAKVPIIVAINKIDKPEAQIERVKKQLADQNLLAEDWGGDTVMVEVSAKQRLNLDLLLEMILLVADLQGLKANPHRPATGTVLESRLDRGRGPVATVLVQNGMLQVGDAFIVGAIYGKVRAMLDDRARPSHEALPSTPVEVLGLEDVPQVGDRMQVIEDTLKARQIAIHRQSKTREAALAKSARLSLEQLHEQLAAGDVKELPLIIKGDVQGSVEALTETLNRLSGDKVKIKVIHAGVGAITEWDVLLASTSNAVVVGFNVRPERKASELAQLEEVDIRLHTIIYNVTEEIKKAMAGLLAVKIKETILGHAEVRDTFRISKVGTVAGCHVQDGKFARDSRIRLLRDNVVVYDGRARSLRRFKDDVEEVRSGMDCGISLENYNDVKVGDVVEAYVTEKVTEPVLV